MTSHFFFDTIRQIFLPQASLSSTANTGHHLTNQLYIQQVQTTYLVRNTSVEFKQIAKCDRVTAVVLMNAKHTDYIAQLNHFTADVHTCLLATKFCLGPGNWPAIVCITLTQKPQQL